MTPRLRVTIVAFVAACAGWVSAAPQSAPDLESLMTRVGERVAEYHRRAQSVVCVEQSTVQPIQSNWDAEGMARTVESELRVESPADGDAAHASVVRDIRRINGRAPRPRDAKDRTGCTDPTPLSPEPLAFLLPEQRADYRFTSLRTGKDSDRAALIVDFVSTRWTSKPELIEDPHGHDDCFDWSGPLATRGRVWVDAGTHDVLRVERRLSGPVDVHVPTRLQRRYNLDPWVVIDRDEQSMRFKPVAFRDPDEVMLLPESVVSLTVVRGGLQSARRTETLSSCRRFLTGGRIVKDPSDRR
jgi:hypothetical protein